MPGFTTHIIMGQECAEEMEGETHLGKLLKEGGGPYACGLQGPDVYFYHPLCTAEGTVKNIGGVMHEGGTKAYFDTCLRIIGAARDGDQKDTMVKYLAGFISHYYTDSICHPYVYSRIGYDASRPGRQLFGAHGRLEDEIDLLYFRRYGHLPPKEYHPGRMLALSDEERAVLVRFMAESVSLAYGEGTGTIRLTEMKASQCLVIFHRGIQVRGMRKDCPDPEEKVLNLDHERWANSWDRSVVSTKSFPELFAEALEMTLKALPLLETAAESGSEEDRTALLSLLGSRSYHSGFEV